MSLFTTHSQPILSHSRVVCRKILILISLCSDDLSVHLRAAQLALLRLYDEVTTPAPYTFPRPPPTVSSSGAREDVIKPLLVVMTAETGVVEKLQALDERHQFEIILSPSAEFTREEQEEYTKLFVPPPETPATSRRWIQATLYDASPGLRLALSRQLISELFVYAKLADAFVVSGNSNLGRLALLLAGEEGAMGYGIHEDARRRVLGGRVRSIDLPYYPTAYRERVFLP